MNPNQNNNFFLNLLRSAGIIGKQVLSDVGQGLTTQFTPVGMAQHNLNVREQGPEVATQQLAQEAPADLYKALGLLGYVLNPAMPITGGAINTGIEGVQNLILGKPQNYVESFAKGMSRTAPLGALSTLSQALLPALQTPITRNYVTKGQENALGIVNKAAGENPSILLDFINQSIPRILKAGAREGIEGVASGAMKPLEQNETRQEAIINDVLMSVLSGMALQGAGESWENLIKPGSKQFVSGLKEGLQGNRQSGMVNFGADVGDEVTKGRMGDVSDPLIQEAKKYKTADEFVKSYDLYHGTPYEIEGGKLKFGAGKQLKKGGYMGGHFLTNEPDIANTFSFGGKVYQASGDIKNKVLDVNKNKFEFAKFIGQKYKVDDEWVTFTKDDFDFMFPKIDGKRVADWSTVNVDAAKAIGEKMGKIGVAIPEYAGGKEGITYQLWKDEIPVYTKSQLEDIWKKANVAQQPPVSNVKRIKK